MTEFEQSKNLEDIKAKYNLALEDHKSKLSKELELVRSSAIKDLEIFKYECLQTLEKIKLESLKQTEIVKLNLQEGIERVKIEGNRDIELIKLRKQVWDKAIDTQMHFNEMSVKSRQLGLSFVVAALGLAVVLLGKNEGVTMTIPMPCIEFFGCSSPWSFSSHIAAVIVLVAAAALYAVRRLDLDVYHRMLRGAVAFGEDMETESIKARLMQTPHGMTELVSLHSRYADIKRKPNGKGYDFDENKKVNAAKKIAIFYRVGVWALIAIGLFLLFSFSNGASHSDQTKVITSLKRP